jgi:hypothetical protein
MTDRKRAFPAASILLMASWPLIAACDTASQQESRSRPPVEPSAQPSASAPRSNAADNELAEVVEKAAQELAQPLEPDPGAGGPPPNGILGPERAQREAASGSVPKLTLATPGSEPRVNLAPNRVADKQPGQIEMAVRTGPRAALPTVVFRLEALAPKAEADATGLVLDVLSADLGAQQPGQIPESTAQSIKKLKGTRFGATLRNNALVGALRFERAKAAAADLDLLLTTATDALTSVVASLPEEPVGKGATWMVSSRETFMGTDVVAYRLFRVEEVSAEGVIVNLDTKRYMAGGALALPGIVDNEVLQFEATDEAQFRFVPGQRLPVEGQLLQQLSSVLSSGGNQTPVQLEARALFAFPARSGAGSTGPAGSRSAPGAP